ncbi:MAG: hypothetical protein ACRD3C_14330 [Vicinamibacterales bacterium]
MARRARDTRPGNDRGRWRCGVLIGFGSDEDWFEYRLEHHPAFLRRIEEARAALLAGRGIPLRAIG